MKVCCRWTEQHRVLCPTSGTACSKNLWQGTWSQGLI